jgi:hypothetical protein
MDVAHAFEPGPDLGEGRGTPEDDIYVENRLRGQTRDRGTAHVLDGDIAAGERLHQGGPELPELERPPRVVRHELDQSRSRIRGAITRLWDVFRESA